MITVRTVQAPNKMAEHFTKNEQRNDILTVKPKNLAAQKQQ